MVTQGERHSFPTLKKERERVKPPATWEAGALGCSAQVTGPHARHLGQAHPPVGPATPGLIWVWWLTSCCIPSLRGIQGSLTDPFHSNMGQQCPWLELAFRSTQQYTAGACPTGSTVVLTEDGVAEGRAPWLTKEHSVCFCTLSLAGSRLPPFKWDQLLPSVCTSKSFSAR